jgi:AcrR family transcriptional regulator
MVVIDETSGDRPVTIGRPRAFDMDKVLDRALEVFWRKGYEGATIAELTEAMGINPPSLYAAFGSKQGLFCKALGRYKAERDAFWNEALNAPTARAVASALLRGSAEFLSNPRHPRGCLSVQGALACGEEAEAARQELEDFRKSSQAAIRQRFKQALKQGDLRPGSDPAALARYLATVIEGMAVEAASGASRKELERVADTALRAFPA